MIDIIKKQYMFVLGSRAEVLDFIEDVVGSDFATPVPAFENSTIRYQLAHIYNTYIHWLGNFAMKQQIEVYDDKQFADLPALRTVIAKADYITDLFLDRFSDKLNVPISGVLSRNRHVTATPLEVWTHVLTHEFHHKGQIMSMCRLLGYTPPDTDVIRF